MITRPVDKKICVERRVDNSRRLHFNHLGDWRPRLVIWPEYDGKTTDEYPSAFDKVIAYDTENEWGEIVAAALDGFNRELAQEVIAFERALPGVWRRLVSQYAMPNWKRNHTLRLDATYINGRKDVYGDEVFLIAPIESLGEVPAVIDSPVLDRTNLLPYGTAILDFGIEEPVMKISFADHEEVFLAILERNASDFGYQTVLTDKHFVSHWIVANPSWGGPDYRQF